METSLTRFPHRRRRDWIALIRMNEDRNLHREACGTIVDMLRQIHLPSVGNRQLRWALALPKLGIVLLLVALLAFLALLHTNEAEEERAALIKDVLWLEQNLRFHLNGNEEQVQQLASDLSNTGEGLRSFRLRANHLLKNNPEMTQLLWLDGQRRIIDTLPGDALPDREIEAFGPAATEKAFEMARRLGHRVYSEPFFLDGNRAHIELLVPIYSNRRQTGMLVALYPLDKLLGNLVPWWFTEKYRVAIVDDNDVEYASKTQIQGNGNQNYAIPLDPPGYGLKLQITSFRSPENSLQQLLVIVIVTLCAGVFGSLWIVHDLMKKRSRAEEALRAEHAFRKAMEDSLTVGMRARDLQGKVIYVNQAFCRMTGFSSQELVDRMPPMPYWIPEQIEEAYAIHQTVLAGEAPEDGFEMTFQRRNGERFQALVYEAQLIDGNGQHTGWMASVIDITERRRAEELARQQQEQLQFTARLVTLGEMASTLAHELNQPLAAIASYNAGCQNLLASAQTSPADLQPALEKIAVQARRAGLIIRRVHDFVRRSEPKCAPCLLGDVIADCIGFVEIEARKRRLRIRAETPELPALLADRLMLEQVLLNLIRNGMEAMATTPEAYRELRIVTRRQGAELHVSVIDNGCGLAQEIRGKLFSAFVTTKAEGMGVGLSICRSIVEFHRGRLWAEDNTNAPTGSGTIFTFSLPMEAT